MIKTLELYCPVKPYIVTQPWGERNDAYLRFGFSRHNGVDFLPDKDKIVKAMCEGTVTSIGNNPTGSGIYVRYRTDLVMCEGVECYVEFYLMHAEKILVNIGDRVKVGTPLLIADNTGFSTGAHTHISAYRISKEGRRLDNDASVNNTFDFTKYFNGKHADDTEALLPFNNDIRYKDEGQEVKRLQMFLSNIGYFDIEPTGYFGDITKAALYEFQKKYVAIDTFSSLQVWINKGRAALKLTRAAINKLI